MQLPPGVRYLLRHTHPLVAPSVTVYLTIKALDSFGITECPTWALVIATVLAKPLLLVFQVKYANRKNERLAAAHGAVLPPLVKESSRSIIAKGQKARESGYPADNLFEWAQEYGNSYRFNLFTAKFFVTLEPDHVKAILATQFDSFVKGPMFLSQMDTLLGSGVFNADGEMWKFHRAMTRPFFTRERISDFEIYERNCDVSLSQARVRLTEGYPVEFQDLVSRFTLDSATEFLFGESVGSLCAGIAYPPSAAHKTPASFYNHPSRVFAEAFTLGQETVAKRFAFGNEWQLAEFFGDKIRPFRKVMDNFTRPLMKAALEKRERELREKGGVDEKKEEEGNLLAHLVKHTQDEKILQDELVNLLVAGRDTTMSLLTFSMYMLTQHPDIERRLREEIFEKVGPKGVPTYQSMRDMKYVRAFLNEVLRLYPPVPVDSRTTLNDVVLPSKKYGQDPFFISKGTTSIYSVLYMHRRTDLWGPDALTFDPDRFLDKRLHKYLTPNPFIFCPFNAGPRICLGQQFAYHEATFYLVRLLQNFTNFTLDEEANIKPPEHWKLGDSLVRAEKIYPMAHLTMYVKGGLWVHMKELNGSEA
ncbi:hypothetical protein NLJ89_g4236 [Agrocybe chaxingu]|uniref:Cytochrome P450 n=1 Tax=Agrocybe chaxingu TaxID=84603 RepID=A0A9W8MUR1_9AGAR|nr:hypothetical protein NLJ89_g4236 [Agrocybe chaxingu]